MEAETPVLYSYYRSSCSWRVRIALNLAGLEVEQLPVHLVNNGGEQHSEQYRSLNPMCQVPTLKINGLTLTQSVAIMEYLHDLHPEAGLLPSSPDKRAVVRMVSEMIASGIQPIQNLAVMKHHSSDPAERQAWAHHWISVGFAALEIVLKTTAGLYCVGDTVTMADCCLVPQVFNAKRWKVDVAQYPTIAAIEARLSKLEPFIKASPANQPDCPKE